MASNAGSISPPVKQKSTDKSLVNVLNKLHKFTPMMKYDQSIMLLPPYWFDPENVDRTQAKERIMELEKLRDKLIDEINYLKSITYVNFLYK
jgi:hypothetical protein